MKSSFFPSTFSSSLVSHDKFVPFQGLIVSSRLESLQHFKKPWAHEHEPVKGLLDAVKVKKVSQIFP